MKRVLSICIPTFNRFNILYPTIQNLLKSKSMDFKIHIVDNYSNDPNYKKLLKINDSRLEIISRNKQIPGQINIIKSIFYGDSKFSMILLDKDKITIKYLENIINHLKNTNSLFGYFVLNSQLKKINYTVYNNITDNITKMSLNCKHPSGMFYKTSYLNKIATDQVIVFGDSFGFYPDIINFIFALNGKGEIINIKFVDTETLEECKKTKTYSFNNKNSFFLPKKRFDTFKNFIIIISKYNLSDKLIYPVLKNIFKSSIYLSTIEYKRILFSEELSQHYGFKKRKVNYVELVLIILAQCFRLMISKKISFKYKILIFLSIFK